MKVMKREDWPDLMDSAEESVLILAPWIDDALIEELFSFLPPIDVRIVFPRSTLKDDVARGARYALRGVLDTNLDAEIRVIDEEMPACLVVDGERFYYAEAYADLLREKATDDDDAISYTRDLWSRARNWE